MKWKDKIPVEVSCPFCNTVIFTATMDLTNLKALEGSLIICIDCAKSKPRTAV